MKPNYPSFLVESLTREGIIADVKTESQQTSDDPPNASEDDDVSPNKNKLSPASSCTEMLNNISKHAMELLEFNKKLIEASVERESKCTSSHEGILNLSSLTIKSDTKSVSLP